MKSICGRCGRVVTTASLLPTTGIASKDALRQQIPMLLDEDSEGMGNGESLIDYELNVVRIMELATRWRRIRGNIDFIALVRNPTLDSWWALLYADQA